MPNSTSQHILGTAANLLGFCLFVITSIHFADKTELSLIDELTSVIAVFLTLSCVFSFASIRTKNKVFEHHYERIADYIFLVSLIGILVIILLIAFNIMK